MRRRELSVGVLAVLASVGLVSAAFGGLMQAGATSGNGNGKGKGREKVTICHKGKTIRVGAPAVKAHFRHGDTPGTCGAPAPVPPGPGQAVIVVFKYVINDNGGTKTPADFTITINGVSVVGGNSFPGSSSGVAKVVQGSGSYTVTEGAVSGYALTSSTAGCAGTIAPGQEKTCLLVNDDQRP
jgi:hypothetical protein